jgi:phage terminase large subunit
MAAAEVATRPVDYVPRPQFAEFHERGKRWAVIVAHRRAGKTVACVMDLITRALATGKVDARYAYIAPYFSQAKAVAWDYLKRYSREVVVKQSESELSVELRNGSRIRLFGADNPDALRGMYLDGVVLDEFADMRPTLWGEVIRPLLSDRKGWAVFIGTPKGRNVFYDIHVQARTDADWLSLTLRASETGLIDADELADAKKSMTESQYEQEFECSFEAAVQGAIYAKELAAVRVHGRIKAVPYEPTQLVSTAWDIGYGDSTAIWFSQVIDGRVRLIDYYEDSGEPVMHYLQILKSKGYRYDTTILPHDAETNGKYATGKSIADVVRGAGFGVKVVKNVHSVEHGINQARLLLPKCEFDIERTKAGLEALQHYQWDYNARLDEFKPTPLHNWASHGSDAFRYLALGLDTQQQAWKPIRYDSRGIV